MSILAPVSGTTLDVNGVRCGIRLRGEGEDAVTEEVPEDGGMRATVEFVVPWEERYDLIKALAGSVTPATSGTPQRTPPWAYPPNPQLYVNSIAQIRGIGPYRDATGFVAYRIAVVPAVFMRPKWDFGGEGATISDPSGVPWTTTKFKVSAESFTPSFTGLYQWITGQGGPQDGKPVPDLNITIIQPHLELSITRHWMPYVPVAEALLYAGRVNSVAIKIGNRVFPVGTLLFGGMNASDSVDTLGERAYEVEYILIGNHDRDWNSALQNDANYYRVNSVANGSGVFPFPYDDFWNGLP